MRLNLQANTKLPSNRIFGFLFAAIFAGLSAYGAYRGWSTSASMAWAIAAIALLAVTLLYPVALSPFNRGWFLLGVFLGKVVSPIVLGVISFVLITPIAMIGRLLGRDELRLTLMSSIRRFLVDASVVLASVVLTFLALNVAFNIAMPYSIKQGVIFPRALLNLIGPHYHTFYPDTNDEKFDDWVAVLGDLVSAGSGDAFLNGDYDYSIFHHMHRADGRNYYVFGRAGFGSLQSVQEYFVTTNEIKRGLFYPEYHEPNEILFLFFEGNDLDNNIGSFERRSDPALSASDFVDRTLDESWSFRRRKEFYLPLLELLSPRLLRKALHFSNPEPQPSDPNNFIRFQDGTLRQFVVENPQAASVELDAQKTDLAMQVLRQSLVRLKNQSSSIPIKVVYIPSVTTSYTWKGPIKFRAYQRGGPLFTSTEENLARSRELRKRVSDVASELGFAFIDTTDTIIAAGKTEFVHGEKDPQHFNKRGYGIVADILLQDEAKAK